MFNKQKTSGYLHKVLDNIRNYFWFVAELLQKGFRLLGFSSTLKSGWMSDLIPKEWRDKIR